MIYIAEVLFYTYDTFLFFGGGNTREPLQDPSSVGRGCGCFFNLFVVNFPLARRLRAFH